jgi:hypothetical protein
MVIPVNKKYRITSDSRCWQVQKRKADRKDAERWDPIYFCVDFENALVSLAELRIRLIDSSVLEEIKAAIRDIRDECVTAAEMFRELAV